MAEIGNIGQQKLLHSSVLCVGAGGLGSPLLLYLAAAGIGKLGIIDADKVELSNLQRQILFDTEDIGFNKAEQAKKKLSRLNPDIDIKIYYKKLDINNVENLFTNYDVIVDCSDNFATKYLINDAAIKYNRPWIFGAINEFDGQVSVFNNHSSDDKKDHLCYRCLYPFLPNNSSIMNNCTNTGIIGAVAGMVGITQAMQVIQLIVPHKNFKPLIKKLWLINTKTMEAKTLNLKQNINCLNYNLSSQEIDLNYQGHILNEDLNEITYDKINKNMLLVDIRELEERNEGFITGSIHLPFSKIIKDKKLPLNKKSIIVLYCQGGLESAFALKLLTKRGYNKVVSLKGGYKEWLLLHTNHQQPPLNQ